ncbi:MAG: YqaA family protein [Kordiimonas sp.]
MADIAIYAGLFWNAFLAATLLPAFSEIALAALLHNGNGIPFLLFLAATLGNVLGSVVNWWLGRGLANFQNRPWFPFKPHHIERATDHFSRYGKWSLLFAWLPVIGDPLTLVAGILRTPFPTFLLLVTFSKASRYGVILLLFY